ncbi:helix-turn-helix transcriptional regulator [Halosegnis longus]|uniref:Helix-turn-helix domain-containing protein n=1 Tax=Halosegnis longus TaxID=2216012 RepID=A0AAJ4UWP1_9EURY|nr:MULTISPECIES: hypothetical protein [Halobacteriales]RNJ27263.1 hypothetical protein Nmn1133_11620 [Salella cibi]
MRSECRPLLWLLLVALALSAGAGGGVATGHTTQQELRPAATTFDVQLTPSGDADWTVSTQFQLATENETEAFERLAARFEAGEADLAYDAETFREAAARGAPGREMSIRAVEYEANTTTVDGQRIGRLSLRFEWANFAETTGETYRLGDAFNTTDGTWLPGLASDQALVIRPPEGYSVETAPVPVNNGVLRWEGRQSFTPGYLGQITYTGDTSTPGPNGPSAAVLGGIGVLIVVILAGGYLWWQRQPNVSGDGTPASGTDGGAGGAVAGGAATADDTDEPASGKTAPVGEDGEPDPELLSDEERVLRLLEANDGRMKQGTIVEETGWSNAKVSQLLSAMDEADEIEKLRIGRENLISLPGEGVGDIDDK